MIAGPSRAVMTAFGCHGEPEALGGGEGVAFRVGSVVLKPVLDIDETNWVQRTLAAIKEDRFRVAQPIAADTGGWVHDRWSASTFVPGLRPAVPHWDIIIEAGLRFGESAEHVRPSTSVLHTRTHRWAIADRVAWSEVEPSLSTEAGELHDRLVELLDRNQEAERHFVHGDLSGNVFLDAEARPVILDVSPYLRPRRWAAAIVVADAVLWYGAENSLAERFADHPKGRDLFARALIFRLAADQASPDPRQRCSLETYRRALRAIE